MDERYRTDPLTLLKKTEAELREREAQLSRINQEVYKKNLELLKEKRRLETILYNMAEAVFVLDLNLRFTLFNNKASLLLGFKEEEVLEKDCDQVVSLFDEKGVRVFSSEFLSLADRKLNPLRLKEGEFRLKTKAGDRIVKINASQISTPYEEKKELVVLVNDITAEKEVERLKDEFISIVSHELRTPMTSIKGNLWMLAAGKGGELSEKAEGYLSKAIKGADRMIALIADILNASSLEQGRIDLKVEPIDLKDLVLEELDEMRARADQKGIKLEVGSFEGIPKVLGDKRRILEIIVNFLGNSIKFTQGGFVKFEAKKEGGMVKVSVIDSGRGFSKDDKARLFSKFGRLDNSYVTVAEAGGTGLGLYITKMLVEKMGGAVGAESPGAGKGATFWFTVPAA